MPRSTSTSIFGTHDADDDPLTTEADNFTPNVALRMLDANDDAEDAVEAFDALITALSGADAFVAATEEDGDGVLEKAALFRGQGHGGLRRGEEHVGGGTWEPPRTRASEPTGRRRRMIATEDLKHVDDDQDTDGGGTDGATDSDETDMDMGKIGVFAYSVIDDVTKTIDLPTTGNLQYMGETVAVTSGESPAFYFGEIEIQVRW